MGLELGPEGELALCQRVVPLAGADATLGVVILCLRVMHVLQADGLRMGRHKLVQFSVGAG